MSVSGLGPLERFAMLAETLAAAWGARARGSTTLGQERAVLRLCGVQGLDRAGQPLGSRIVDGYVGGGHDRLAGGILLPFAMASIEYDLVPQELALEIAAGTIDLAMEAALLSDPASRTAAEALARRLIASAMDRADANRTARRELVSVLGESSQPWYGSTLLSDTLPGATAEALRHIDAGADLIRVAVPAGRELSRSRELVEERELPTAQGAATGQPRPADGPPAGSQRGLAELRHFIDEAGAERRRYVRLATVGAALTASEHAVVAAFERVDLVEADPIAEIVTVGVDPDRALADHAFAHRILRRGGTSVLLDAGPLVVAPDLARGFPSDPATRAGRALALQLLSVAFARSNGLADEQVLVGAMPPWLAEERNPTVQAIAQVALRRALFPRHPLVFDEPAESVASEGWPFMFAAAVADADPIGLVLRRAEPQRLRQVGEATRAAARVGREVGQAFGPRPLHGVALEHARAAVLAGVTLLERLRDEGWEAILGAPIQGVTRSRIGRDTVVERADERDPLGESTTGIG